jgi:hypothetical protein
VLIVPRYRKGKELTAEEALEKKLGDGGLDRPFVGIDFQGVQHTSRMYKIFTLYDCVRAHVMDEEIPKEKTKVELYMPDTSPDFFAQGGIAVVKNVPSLSRRSKDYDMRFKHIPVMPAEGEISDEMMQDIVKASYNLLVVGHGVGACERTLYFDVKYGRGGETFSDDTRKGDEQVHCHHVILAAYRTEKEISEQYPHLRMITPYIRPDEGMEDFFWKLLNNVMLERIEEGKIRLEPLGATATNMEIALQKYAASRNLKS